MRAILVFILVILLLGLAAAFAALNDGVILINYFIGQSEIRVTYLLLACFAIGGLMGLLLISGSYFKLRLQNRKLRNSASMNTQELNNLRELPMKNSF